MSKAMAGLERDLLSKRMISPGSIFPVKIQAMSPSPIICPIPTSHLELRMVILGTGRVIK